MANLRAAPRFIGIDNKTDASELTLQHAVVAQNAQLDTGNLKKRDGYVKQTDLGSNAILGMFDFRRNSGAVDTLIKHGTQLYVRQTTTNTLLQSSLSSTEVASFAVHSDRCYYVDGTNLKATDSITSRNAALVRPGSAATVATGAAGNLTGSYDYKWTYYSPSWGQESAASDVSSLVEPSAEKVTVSGFTASPDSDVTKIRIYRRKESHNETLWFFVAEILDSVSSYPDDTLDVDVSLTDISPLSYIETLPGFRYLEQHSGVMFLAGDDDKLYFTQPDKPWSVTNWIRVGGEGGVGKITGLKSFLGLLVVFKEDSIWTLSGITADTFNARLILNGTGCAGGHSIVSTGELIYFLGEDAFYAFDGQRAIQVSEPIQPDVLARNRSRDNYVVGANDEENQAIIWSYSGPSSSINNKVVTFFYGNTRKTEGQHSWCPWKFNTGLTSIARVTTDATTRDRIVWYGFVDGVIGEPGGDTDNTAAIEFQWQTSKWDGGVPGLLKAWDELSVELVPQSNYSHLEVRYYRDSDTSHQQLDVMDPREATHQFRVSDYARDLRLEFYQNSVEPMEIVSFEVSAMVEGRA